jgi:phage terminase small subunit
MGRHPKPLKLAIMDGTYRTDRNKFSPGAGGEIKRPNGLGRYGNKLWKSTIDYVVAIGGGECDTESLASMCKWYNEYRRIAFSVEKMSPMDDNYRTLLYAMATAFRQFSDMAGRFGLTPVDRAKLKVEPTERKDEKEEKYFG